MQQPPAVALAGAGRGEHGHGRVDARGHLLGHQGDPHPDHLVDLLAGLLGGVVHAEHGQQPAARAHRDHHQDGADRAPVPDHADQRPDCEPADEAPEALQRVGLGRDAGQAQVLLLALLDGGQQVAQRLAGGLRLAGAPERAHDAHRDQHDPGEGHQPRCEDQQAHIGSLARLRRRGATSAEFSSRTTEWYTKNTVAISSMPAIKTNTIWPVPSS